MSHFSTIFDRKPVEIQKRNGFDLSHYNTGTVTCGTLTPVLTKFMIPNSKFSLGAQVSVSLPPAAAPFYGRLDACIEAFFVPCRLLYGGWKRWISNNDVHQRGNNSSADWVIPTFNYSWYDNEFVGDEVSLLTKVGSLADYLGNKVVGSGESSPDFTLLPFLAYHKIWDCWYRASRIQNTIFSVNNDNSNSVSYIPHSFYTADGWNAFLNSINEDGADKFLFPDGVSLFELRQRNYAKDYFTNASVDPQQGSTPASLSFTVADGTGSFTIPALRASNSLQKFLEANNMGGGDYGDIMFVQYGVRPADDITDRPVYLGRLIVPIYANGVTNNSNSVGTSSRNPFVDAGSIGSKGATLGGNSEGSIVDSWTATEHGYLMCLFSLVPHAMYGQGVRKYLFDTTIGKIPFPLLQSVGMDEIKSYEIYADGDSTYSETFGYSDRYSSEKFMLDEVHGLLRPGRSLQHFMLQRIFSESPDLGTDFLEIGTNDLDGVFAVSQAASGFSCWYQIYWSFKCSMPLATYSIPTLGDLKDTRTVYIQEGGRRL